MTPASRTVSATLILALVLSSFGYGLSPVRADDTGTDASVNATPSGDTFAPSTNTPSAPDATTTPTDTAVSTSTPELPFDSVSALLTGSSTASSTEVIGTTTPSTTSTTTTATSTGPTIQSGEAVALANILNIVNTNLVNSSGNALLLNYVAPVTGPIDLRNGTPVFATSSPVCALIACAGTGGVSVNLASGADIHNAVVLSATSGGNLIDMGSTTGDATISTGNSYAGLNLINIANTNIVDSNYLLVTLNAFQGVSGDIIFPSLTNLLSALAHNLSPGSVSSTNTGTVTNNVTTDAQTGGNNTDGTSSSITTGHAHSTGSVFNQLNTNLLGGSTVAILFRIQGNWAGKVFGAPQGLQWTQGPGGTIALFDSDSNGSTGTSLAQLTASSTARINNDVSVVALTGDNLIKNANTALITTGNAFASANVINVANTNVVGKNWIMAIVNIFGDFTGNIAFGRPDLFVGEQVTVPSFVGNGSPVSYKFTVINNGDAPASNVVLTDAFDHAHLNITNSSATYTTDSSGHLVWNLGTIPAGGAVEVMYAATVQNTSPGTDITDTISAVGDEPDNNSSDNTDTTTFTTTQHSSGGRIRAIRLDETNTGTATAHLTIQRASPAATSNGSPVHQTITITNDSSAASIPVIAHDVLTAPNGTQVYDQAWDIGSLAAGDAVQLAYDVSFAPNAPRGTYTLSTVITDEQGAVLGGERGNGSIVLSGHQSLATLASLSSHSTNAAHAHASYLGNSTDANAQNVLPGVTVAHAAGSGNQSAAIGVLSLPWPYLLGAIAVLLGLLTLLAWYRRRQEYR